MTADLSTYRTLLEAQWRAQVSDVALLQVEALDRASSDGSADGSHTESQRVALRLVAAARQQLDDTEAALQRLDIGSFGLCEDCQQFISGERLDALPTARLCMPCQQARR